MQEMLGDHCCQSSAPDTHVESENKNRIQNNVGDRTDQYGEHSGFCESLAVMKLFMPRVSCTKIVPTA